MRRALQKEVQHRRLQLSVTTPVVIKAWSEFPDKHKEVTDLKCEAMNPGTLCFVFWESLFWSNWQAPALSVWCLKEWSRTDHMTTVHSQQQRDFTFCFLFLWRCVATVWRQSGVKNTPESDTANPTNHSLAVYGVREQTCTERQQGVTLPHCVLTREINCREGKRCMKTEKRWRRDG